MPDVTVADALSDSSTLLAGYRPAPGAYDELRGDDGDTRAHWTYVIRSLAALGAVELNQRWRDARRMLRAGGVTYNVYDDVQYDDVQPAERPWPLDPLPILLPSAEWQVIEHALLQRAELLEAILADLYGPHTLIRRGLIPPEMVYAHPGFARPAVGVPPPGGRSLPLYAADLARRPDGELCVLGDRAQAPSGAGYALENRAVLSRTLPSIFRDAHVHRLQRFFRRMRAAVAALTPRPAESPHVVLLTPGTANETYFEHAFLAGHLGCTLAQGDDLTVRDQRVWLRTLEGLRPVDVILRRVDGAFCDPLELRADSLLGVPGLLQAARQGQVALVNPLGSSLVENPAMMTRLPRLARELLGEDLAMPSVRTWWCGDADGAAYVAAHLERLVIKPIFPQGARSAIFGAALDRSARDAIAAAIRERPCLYVGQEHLSLSTTPVVVEGCLEPRAMVVRAFVAADADGYTVMPGGLGRVASSRDSSVVSNSRGGVSKDVWVLASEPERDTPFLIPPDHPVAVVRGGEEVPGRVADNLFWVGRYAERAGAGARILRETLRRLFDLDAAAGDPHVPALLRAVTMVTGTFPGFIGSGAGERLAAPDAELCEVAFESRRTGSLRFNISALVRAGRAVRDRFSIDTWQVISALDRELGEPGQLEEILERLERVLILLAAVGGLSADSMSRGQRWRFFEIGRRVERACTVATLLRVVCPPGRRAAAVPWEALLATADASVTYRRRYRSTPDPAAVLDLLIDDETNPRSLLYQVLQLAALTDGLSGGSETDPRPREQVIAGELLAAVRERGEAGTALRGLDPALDDMLAQVLERLGTLSEQLDRSYFRRGAAAQQLVRVR